MKKIIFAMSEEDVKNFMSDSRDVKQAALKMTSKEMHAAFDELKKLSKANVVSFAKPKADAGNDVEEESQLYTVTSGVAHIPVLGLLTPKASPCDLISGESVTEYGFIREALMRADEDEEVEEIALDFESGGGYVSGVDETAQVIAASIKPTTAVVHSLCASAAYWLASQCDRIIATSPASQIGSIGVAMEMDDHTEENRAAGIEHRVFTSKNAPDKRPDAATDEGKAVIQKELDDLHEVFADRIAEGRGTTRANVYKNYGRGAVLCAKEAMARGMIDEIVGLQKADKTAVGGNKQKADAESNPAESENKEEKKLTLEEMKAECPEIEEALKAKFEEGISAERKRRDALAKFRGINADGDNAVEEAIASGASVEDAQAVINAAVLKGNTAPGTENAPAIATGSDESEKAYGENVSAEDAEWYKQHGMSADDVAKYVG